MQCLSGCLVDSERPGDVFDGGRLEGYVSVATYPLCDPRQAGERPLGGIRQGGAIEDNRRGGIVDESAGEDAKRRRICQLSVRDEQCRTTFEIFAIGKGLGDGARSEGAQCVGRCLEHVDAGRHQSLRDRREESPTPCGGFGDDLDQPSLGGGDYLIRHPGDVLFPSPVRLAHECPRSFAILAFRFWPVSSHRVGQSCRPSIRAGSGPWLYADADGIVVALEPVHLRSR